MLVLSRKKSEGIVIKGRGLNIRIVVLESEKGKTRLGIEAPKGYLILREELLAEIERSNKLAALTDFDQIGEILRKRKGENETERKDIGV